MEINHVDYAHGQSYLLSPTKVLLVMHYQHRSTRLIYQSWTATVQCPYCTVNVRNNHKIRGGIYLQTPNYASLHISRRCTLFRNFQPLEYPYPTQYRLESTVDACQKLFARGHMIRTRFYGSLLAQLFFHILWPKRCVHMDYTLELSQGNHQNGKSTYTRSI